MKTQRDLGDQLITRVVQIELSMKRQGLPISDLQRGYLLALRHVSRALINNGDITIGMEGNKDNG